MRRKSFNNRYFDFHPLRALQQAWVLRYENPMVPPSPETSDTLEKAAYVAAALVVICAIIFAIWGGREICGDQLNLRLGEAELDIPVMPNMRGSSALIARQDRRHPLGKAPCRGDEPVVRSVVFSATTPKQKALYQSQGYRYLPFLTLHLDPSPRDFERANCAAAIKATTWKTDPAHANFARTEGKGVTYYASKKPLLYGRKVYVTCTAAKDCHAAVATDIVSIQLDFSGREVPDQWASMLAEVERFTARLGIYPTTPETLPDCE